MDDPRRIVGVYRLEAGASGGNSALIPRVHYSDCRRDRDVLTIYHDPEVGMYVKGEAFAPEAGKREVVCRLLALIESDASNYYGYKNSQQDDEPWYPSPLILPWPTHPLASPPPRARIRLFDELILAMLLIPSASEVLHLARCKFEALLERPRGVGTWTYLALPPGQERVLGTSSRLPVKGTIDGVRFRSSLLPNG